MDGRPLSLWKEAGWGWSMWNLRGPFGVLDSGRADVAYEDFRGPQARPEDARAAARRLRPGETRRSVSSRTRSISSKHERLLWYGHFQRVTLGRATGVPSRFTFSIQSPCLRSTNLAWMNSQLRREASRKRGSPTAGRRSGSRRGLRLGPPVLVGVGVAMRAPLVDDAAVGIDALRKRRPGDVERDGAGPWR
jgi:hypothetical protein